MTRIRPVLIAGTAALGLVLAAPSNGATTALVATVGPSATISLTKAGKKVKTLKPGSYRITVRDRSNFHNFHLRGPGGLNKTTTVSQVATKTWTVTFKAGTYRYVCDPHAATMKGSFTVK